jgi:hypothetical protein
MANQPTSGQALPVRTPSKILSRTSEERLNPIVVVGSVNADLVVRAPRTQRRGETVPGTRFRTFCGGKGANQAVAMAKLFERIEEER